MKADRDMSPIIEFPDEQAAALEAKAQADGLSAEQYARKVPERDLGSPEPRPHVSEAIRENMSDFPADVLGGRAQVPTSAQIGCFGQ